MISANSNMLHGTCYVENFDQTFHIKYDIEKCLDNSGKVASYYISTDAGYEFSFNAYKDDTDASVIQLAETLIKSEWEDENV
ncbi:conserved hypothetical protein [Edwardsiella phage PEi26]|uniref:Uncharacterized protein n=1 Tax=Edwardsiella phage PEi26 TaxID=1608311 RepID=A0A0B6VTT7_9CAUD|nr:conserved hypothetical protein [Edwardsiella phage PEi26]